MSHSNTPQIDAGELPLCHIIAPNHNDDMTGAGGCLLPSGHIGPHICQHPKLGLAQWADDDECECCGPESDPGNCCIWFGAYAEKPKLSRSPPTTATGGDGWKLVPRTMTPTMHMRAGQAANAIAGSDLSDEEREQYIYAAVLDASPKSDVSEPACQKPEPEYSPNPLGGKA